MLSQDHFQHFIKSSLPIFEMTSKRRNSFSIKSMINIRYFPFDQDLLEINNIFMS